jgi:hypothetical protein
MGEVASLPGYLPQTVKFHTTQKEKVPREPRLTLCMRVLQRLAQPRRGRRMSGQREARGGHAMMRLQRASVFALFLLASAATAHAECAWVLWEQTTTWKASPKNVEETQWAPVTAALARPICESSKAV